MREDEGFLEPAFEQAGAASRGAGDGRPVRTWEADALSDDLSATFERLIKGVRAGDLQRCEHGLKTPIIVPSWDPSARCPRCPPVGDGDGEPCLLCGNEDASCLSLRLGDWVMLLRLCPDCRQRQDIRPAEGGTPELDAAGGTSVPAARLWLYLVTSGHPRVAWFCTSIAYRLAVLQRISAGEHPIAVERRVLRGPADAEWESFGPAWQQAMASLVSIYSQDWLADVPVPGGPDRELVEFTPSGPGGPAVPGRSLVLKMLHTAGRWLVDGVEWAGNR